MESIPHTLFPLTCAKTGNWNSLWPMLYWCSINIGGWGHDWHGEHDNQTFQFYFKTPEQLMYFQLSWY